MLFFLHMPRTAGRTYHSCFLKTATPPSRRCEKSYDVLRLNASIPSCGLLSSHDDMSLIDNLPDDAAFVTQLRDPVDRVLSAYEFATEVACRSLALNQPRRRDARSTDTRNVWPWSGLVPWLEDEVQTRTRTAGAANASVEDPYNSPLIVPLAQWIEHPLVLEHIHDGQTLQILGLTNYSHWTHAKGLRHCLQSQAPGSKARKSLMSLALKRLNTFVHVGATELLDTSIASLADTLGLRMQGRAYQTVTPGAFQENEATKQGNVTKLREEQQQLQQRMASADSVPKQVKRDTEFLHKDPLWKALRICEERARQKNLSRRENSLRHVNGLRFSSAARKAIDPVILARIRELNSMDVQLHAEGRRLLDERLAVTRDKLEDIPRLSGHEQSKLVGPAQTQSPQLPQQHHRTPQSSTAQQKDELRARHR
ncbi:hypothetical protein WJX73_005869 [Symbiochloris irregularis]|uniref:Sulfotransferase n=1 Tax=Symbiochloris irregularis TaxID=706552 RepID=A0AAW1P7M2_9CHLO